MFVNKKGILTYDKVWTGLGFVRAWTPWEESVRQSILLSEQCNHLVLLMEGFETS